MFAKIRDAYRDLLLLQRMPSAHINLMINLVRNSDPFYQNVTKKFFDESTHHHRKLYVIGQFTHGVALCKLCKSRGSYFERIESAGRRNVKKARRLGYNFKIIDYNQHLDDIKSIRQSANVRQGELSDDFLHGDVSPTKNPAPLTKTHAYPYFGVLKDGRVIAYAGILIAGELAMIEHIYGHAEHQTNGVVPQLFVGISEYLSTNYPIVKYYGYGSYFGASENLRRFKRKFCFMPHRVKWILGDM